MWHLPAHNDVFVKSLEKDLQTKKKSVPLQSNSKKLVFEARIWTTD